MTYGGGTYPSVSGHPPHLATQYALLAAMSASRASGSPLRWIITTLSGRASAITALSIFPREHFSQYGFDTAFSRDCTPVREVVSGRTKYRSRNTRMRIAVHINDEFPSIFAASSRPADEQFHEVAS